VRSHIAISYIVPERKPIFHYKPRGWPCAGEEILPQLLIVSDVFVLDTFYSE